MRGGPAKGSSLLVSGLAAVGALILAGCHGVPPGSAIEPPGSPMSPTGMTTTPPPASATTPSPSAPRSSSASNAPALSLDGTEIASLAVSGEQVSGRTGVVQADNAYDVTAVCSGGEAVDYLIRVDGADVSRGTVPCGVALRNTAVSGVAGRVQLSLDGGEEIPQSLTATLAVVRADAPWPGEEAASG